MRLIQPSESSTISKNGRRAVVTGLGVVTNIGVGIHEFWENLIDGKSGIRRIEYFDTQELPTHFGGEIDTRTLVPHLPDFSYKLGATSRYALLALQLALADSQLSVNGITSKNIAVSMGTTMGEIQNLEYLNALNVKGNFDSVSKFRMTGYPASEIAHNVSRLLGISGQSMMFTTACSAGNYAVGKSLDEVLSGKSDLAIAGGVDTISRLNYIGFSRLFAMAPEMCQPFDKDRKGMMVGEGAGMLVIESLNHALNRGAHIYAEIEDYALSCDAHHMVEPSMQGVKKCMRKILRNNSMNPNDIDYICCHGTGTLANDRTESQAIYEIFYKNGKNVPASSIKSMMGHTMGAASAIETIACCLAIKHDIMPPTMNFFTNDTDCPIDCIPNKARSAKLMNVINNSFAFGGNNASLLLCKFRQD